jgi:hypothetical protein
MQKEKEENIKCFLRSQFTVMVSLLTCFYSSLCLNDRFDYQENLWVSITIIYVFVIAISIVTRTITNTLPEHPCYSRNPEAVKLHQSFIMCIPLCAWVSSIFINDIASITALVPIILTLAIASIIICMRSREQITDAGTGASVSRLDAIVIQQRSSSSSQLADMEQISETKTNPIH